MSGRQEAVTAVGERRLRADRGLILSSAPHESDHRASVTHDGGIALARPVSRSSARNSTVIATAQPGPQPDVGRTTSPRDEHRVHLWLVRANWSAVTKVGGYSVVIAETAIRSSA
jgi:hypothetical protein